MTDRFTAAPIVRPVSDPWPRRTRLVEHSILPGFKLSLGITLVYLSLIVLIPLAALAVRPWEIGIDGIIRTLSNDRVAAALKVSFGISLAAALVNAPLGLMLAWTLTRYRFPGRR